MCLEVSLLLAMIIPLLFLQALRPKKIKKVKYSVLHPNLSDMLV